MDHCPVSPSRWPAPWGLAARLACLRGLALCQHFVQEFWKRPLPTADRPLSLCLGLPGRKEAIGRLSPLSLCESALSVGRGWPAAPLVAEGRGGRW